MKSKKEIRKRLKLAQESKRALTLRLSSQEIYLWDGRIETLKWVLEDN